MYVNGSMCANRHFVIGFDTTVTPTLTNAIKVIAKLDPVEINASGWLIQAILREADKTRPFRIGP